MMQAAQFINGAFCTGRYEMGRGTDWWMISTFQDGSLKISTLGMTRNFISVDLALEALEERAGLPTGLVNRLVNLRAFKPTRFRREQKSR